MPRAPACCFLLSAAALLPCAALLSKLQRKMVRETAMCMRLGRCIPRRLDQRWLRPPVLRRGSVSTAETPPLNTVRAPRRGCKLLLLPLHFWEHYCSSTHRHSGPRARLRSTGCCSCCPFGNGFCCCSPLLRSLTATLLCLFSDSFGISHSVSFSDGV